MEDLNRTDQTGYPLRHHMRELRNTALSQLTSPTIAENKLKILPCSEFEVIFEANEGIWSQNFEIF